MKKFLPFAFAAGLLGFLPGTATAQILPTAPSALLKATGAVAQTVQWRRDPRYTEPNYGGVRNYGRGYYRGGYGRGYYGRGYYGRGYYGRRNGWRRDWGPGVGVLGGLAAGALLGGAIAGAQSGGPVVIDDVQAYCSRRFRSYDPASGTYLGYDGKRHACP